MRNRNIKLGYLLIGLNNAFFWYAPWLLYLLQHITITEAAVIQAIGMITGVIAEIPSGAFSDLFGKKRTLLLAFLFTAIGEITMAFSDSFQEFALTWIIVYIGYSFYSGTMEAFMYDTLVSVGEEDEYPRVVSRMQMVRNAVIAPASIIGGFLFSYWSGLPFLATGVAKLLGLLVALFVIEPPVDTETFSFRSFVQQTRKGFTHLFTPTMRKYTSLILIYGIFAIIAYEFLDDAAVIDWGYDEVAIGIIYAAATFIAIPASYLYEKVSRHLSAQKLVGIGILLLAVNYLFSPWITVYIWTALFFLRVFYSPIKDSAISEMLNKRTPSRIRATTLSTYELIRKVPYVVLSGVIGSAMGIYGIKEFSFYFALALLGLFGAYVIFLSKAKVFLTQRGYQ